METSRGNFAEGRPREIVSYSFNRFVFLWCRHVQSFHFVAIDGVKQRHESYNVNQQVNAQFAPNKSFHGLDSVARSVFPSSNFPEKNSGFKRGVTEPHDFFCRLFQKNKEVRGIENSPTRQIRGKRSGCYGGGMTWRLRSQKVRRRVAHNQGEFCNKWWNGGHRTSAMRWCKLLAQKAVSCLVSCYIDIFSPQPAMPLPLGDHPFRTSAKLGIVDPLPPLSAFSHWLLL